MSKVVVAKEILKANDALAAANLRLLDQAGVFCINLLGSPGSGKTTLLEKLTPYLKDRVRVGVIEGDLATSEDAERIEKAGLPSIQINTGGGCHLDSNMVANALESLDLNEFDLLFIENVGNLVCTAGHRLGERLRIVVLSAAEGDDKVVKYPPMFQKTDSVLINKADLLPYTDFSVERVHTDARRLNPKVEILQASARTGEGIEEAAEFILNKRQQWINGK